jgi:type I restriction enzyme R subunit
MRPSPFTTRGGRQARLPEKRKQRIGEEFEEVTEGEEVERKERLKTK